MTAAADPDALPRAMGKPALRALAAAGITTLTEAARRRAEELARLHGVGPKALRVLAEAIARRGSGQAGT